MASNSTFALGFGGRRRYFLPESRCDRLRGKGSLMTMTNLHGRRREREEILAMRGYCIRYTEGYKSFLRGCWETKSCVCCVIEKCDCEGIIIKIIKFKFV